MWSGYITFRLLLRLDNFKKPNSEPFLFAYIWDGQANNKISESIGYHQKILSIATLTARTYLHTLPVAEILYVKMGVDCGLWVPNKILLKKYTESLKKNVGAIWEQLKLNSTANSTKLGWKWAG